MTVNQRRWWWLLNRDYVLHPIKARKRRRHIKTIHEQIMLLLSETAGNDFP